MQPTALVSDIRDVLDRPIVVVGAPRCGTTFLARLLGLLPELAVAHEPRLAWKYGNHRRSDMLTAADARPEVRAHIRQHLASVVERQDGRRLVEKTPSNSLRLDFVDAVLPDARYIHVIRDGRDAVASIVERWNTEGKTSDPGVERQRLITRAREATWRQRVLFAGEALRRLMPASRHTPPLWGPRLPAMSATVSEIGIVGVAALQWRTCVEHALAYGRQQLGSRYIEVRYEDLGVDDVERIRRFAELPDDDRLVRQFQERFQAPAARSRDLLSADDHSTVQSWIQATQQFLGYQ